MTSLSKKVNITKNCLSIYQLLEKTQLLLIFLLITFLNYLSPGYVTILWLSFLLHSILFTLHVPLLFTIKDSEHDNVNTMNLI